MYVCLNKLINVCLKWDIKCGIKQMTVYLKRNSNIGTESNSENTINT